MSDPTAPEYLLPQEVADLVRKSVKSVYRMAKDESCPATWIMGSLRFHRERLERWLKACEQGPGRPRRPKLAIAQREERTA